MSGPSERFDRVVNCGWCGRLALDAAAGVIVPRSAWSFRRKSFLRLPPTPATAHIPPTTVVLGGFGDVVRYPCGTTLVSWYQSGCLGLETGLSPEPEPADLDRDGMKAAMLRGAAGVVPALGDVDSGTLAAAELGNGVIFALGRTDVDDPASRLHRRGGGVTAVGRYHSVDTGKLTTAPLIARRLASAVFSGRRVSA